MLARRSLSARALASVLEQSVDCVKFVDLDGRLLWMNPPGQCAMEIDDAATVLGAGWASLWPGESQDAIAGLLQAARSGTSARLTAFCPTAKGSPRWWDVGVSLVRDEADEPAGFLAISRDVTEAERARDLLAVTMAEMRHRLRNSHAIAASLVRTLSRGDPALEAFAGEVAERLSALSRAQALLASGDEGARLGELVPALVGHFAHPDCSMDITLNGTADLLLDRGATDALALALGELAVNSAKHGALGHGGEVKVAAEPEPLRFSWKERSRRPVAAHHRDGGQGLILIDRILRARRGSFRLDWRECGLDAEIRL